MLMIFFLQKRLHLERLVFEDHQRSPLHLQVKINGKVSINSLNPNDILFTNYNINPTEYI